MHEHASIIGVFSMNWSRQKAHLEELMVSVLEARKIPLSLREITEEISESNPSIFTGITPVNSLYSIIYRREKRRLETGQKPIFIRTNIRNLTLYSLNLDNQENK